MNGWSIRTYDRNRISVISFTTTACKKLVQKTNGIKFGMFTWKKPMLRKRLNLCTACRQFESHGCWAGKQNVQNKQSESVGVWNVWTVFLNLQICRFGRRQQQCPRSRLFHVSAKHCCESRWREYRLELCERKLAEFGRTFRIEWTISRTNDTVDLRSIQHKH